MRARTAQGTPHPDDNRKPDGPTDLDKRSWFYVLRKTMHEFTEDECTDLAAALTYYAVLSIFPAMLALISVLGVLGQAQQAVKTVEDTLKPLLSPQTLEIVTKALNNVADSQGAGVALILGVTACPLVGLRVRRGVRPGDEQDLRDRGGSAVLEAAPGHAAPDPDRGDPGCHRPADADRLRAGCGVHRQRDRAR